MIVSFRYCHHILVILAIVHCQFGFYCNVSITNEMNDLYVCVCACVRACVCVCVCVCMYVCMYECMHARKPCVSACVCVLACVCVN